MALSQSKVFPRCRADVRRDALPLARPAAMATPAGQPREEPLRNLSDFLAANERYAATQHRASDAVAPRRRAAVLLCMDARLHPSDFLGVAAGDVHMLRNGGGRVTTDVLQSLVASQQILGTREICASRGARCDARRRCSAAR